jgi:hypothetical protein
MILYPVKNFHPASEFFILCGQTKTLPFQEWFFPFTQHPAAAETGSPDSANRPLLCR